MTKGEIKLGSVKLSLKDTFFSVMLTTFQVNNNFEGSKPGSLSRYEAGIILKIVFVILIHE